MLQQLSLLNPTEPWTVADLTRYIKEKFETDYRLQDVIVTGELSNVSRPRSGHMYFTLKDAQASLRGVMWRGQVARLTYQPQNGDRVLVHGNISVYEASGQYQIYAGDIHLAGTGDLFQQFEALKRALEDEGLFDPIHKKVLPHWPRRLALVTSPTGAALQDMLNVIKRRWPLLEVVVIPTAVQGAAAPPQIVAAIEAADRLSPDTILLARGGGSLEDLWAFNDEHVARAIFATNAPVIAGVGHETDFTIADFVADLRAPTPSAAAEIATPDQREQRQVVDDLLLSFARQLGDYLRGLRWQLAEQQAILWGLSPRAQLATAQHQIANLKLRAALGIRNRLRLQREHLRGLTQTLAGLGPTTTLARGYAIVSRTGTKEIIRSSTAVKNEESLDVRVADGQFGVKVTERTKKS